MSQASLPMYALQGLEAANQALWDRIRSGIPGVPERLSDADAVADCLPAETVFTQVCGFPLFRRFQGQAVMLGIPSYEFEGCEGLYHRSAFIARADDPVESLVGMRKRVFGCNSAHSNTGMNLPRLSVARIAGGRGFFSRVVWTGAHIASLQALAAGQIDLCAVDCVTWGLAQRHLPKHTTGLRVLGWTQPSPCLPFVTSVATPELLAVSLQANLLQQAEARLGLRAVQAPDPAAYDILADYEREAAELGYAVLT